MFKWRGALRFSKTVVKRSKLAHTMTEPRHRQPKTAPWAFILDFDGTITTKDTIETIAKLGISHHASKGLDLQSAWDKIISKYGEDFSNHVEQYRPAKVDRRSLKQEIDYYRSLKEIEIKSFGRVSTSGIFKGIDAKQLGITAVRDGLVDFRDGLNEFDIRTVLSNRACCGVVSVNFSGRFIEGALQAFGLEGIDIRSNHPNANGVLEGYQSFSDGYHPEVIATSEGKLEAMKELLDHWRTVWPRENPPRPVYIGDSGTDIECLTEDGVVGIVISDDGKSGLMETLNRVSVEGIHIGDFQDENRSHVYWARDFTEIVNSPLFIDFPLELGHNIEDDLWAERDKKSLLGGNN